jgi:hypothetical protein
LHLDLSPSEQILCLHQIAAELCRTLEALGSSESTVIKQTLEEMTAEKLQEMLDRVRKLGGNVSKRDLYMAILTQLVEATYSRKLPDGGGAAGGPMFLRILKQWKGIGTEHLQVFRLTVDQAQLRTAGFDDSLPGFREVTGRYLRYLVRSLLNTGRMPILKRLAIISANYAVVDWLARARASQLGRTRAELDDLVYGIQIVEKFLSNRLFNELELQSNFLAKVVLAMFDNPALPLVMLLGGPRRG